MFGMGLFLLACGPDPQPLPSTPGVTAPQPDTTNAEDPGPPETHNETSLAEDSQAAPPSGTGAKCITTAVDDLPTCCPDNPSRCVPEAAVAPVFATLFSTCDGGFCIPESLFQTQGTHEPLACTSALGAEGVCITVCNPQVAAFASLLPQDICADGELCSPCVNPLDGQPTNACQSFSCDADAEPKPPADPPGPPTPTGSCEDPPTTPIISAGVFPDCCEGAHCVPAGLVDDELQANLNPCEGGYCVPDLFIETGGFFTAESCVLPGEVEGRCLSDCLPLIIEQGEFLPQSTCAEAHRCAPCCNPMTGEPTGACDIGCDIGPVDGICEAAYETCCKEDDGHCLPNELIPPEQADLLKKNGCQKGFSCVPDILQDSSHQPQSCTGTILLGPDYTGVCLPKCLKIPFDLFIGTGSCPSDDDCVPCADPFSGEPSGAPGC
jgi:hypothetical protein